MVLEKYVDGLVRFYRVVYETYGEILDLFTRLLRDVESIAGVKPFNSTYKLKHAVIMPSVYVYHPKPIYYRVPSVKPEVVDLAYAVSSSTVFCYDTGICQIVTFGNKVHMDVPFQIVLLLSEYVDMLSSSKAGFSIKSVRDKIREHGLSRLAEVLAADEISEATNMVSVESVTSVLKNKCSGLVYPERPPTVSIHVASETKYSMFLFTYSMVDSKYRVIPTLTVYSSGQTLVTVPASHVVSAYAASEKFVKMLSRI